MSAIFTYCPRLDGQRLTVTGWDGVQGHWHLLTPVSCFLADRYSKGRRQLQGLWHGSGIEASSADWWRLCGVRSVESLFFLQLNVLTEQLQHLWTHHCLMTFTLKELRMTKTRPALEKINSLILNQFLYYFLKIDPYVPRLFFFFFSNTFPPRWTSPVSHIIEFTQVRGVKIPKQWTWRWTLEVTLARPGQSYWVASFQVQKWRIQRWAWRSNTICKACRIKVFAK